jgi:hypothetical protein
MSNVAGKKIRLLESAARTATETSTHIALPNNAKCIGIVMNTTAYTSGNFTAKLQTSSDGTNWTDITTATTAAVAATGQDYAFATVDCFSLVRCVLTGATTPVATQSVDVVFNEGP